MVHPTVALGLSIKVEGKDSSVQNSLSGEFDRPKAFEAYSRSEIVGSFVWEENERRKHGTLSLRVFLFLVHYPVSFSEMPSTRKASPGDRKESTTKTLTLHRNHAHSSDCVSIFSLYRTEQGQGTCVPETMWRTATIST